MAAMSLEQFLENYRDTIDRLYSTSNAAAWRVSRSSFAGALWQSFERRFGPDTGPVTHAEVISFSTRCIPPTLRSPSDAVTATPRLGVISYRRIALPSTPSRGQYSATPPRASEIADSLWADLYGLRACDSERRSPLEHYGGRSSLMSWIRVVVTRLEADRWRATRRMEALDEELDGNSSARIDIDATDSLDPDRARLLAALEQSLREALNALSPRRSAQAFILLRPGSYARTDRGLDRRARVERVAQSRARKDCDPRSRHAHAAPQVPFQRRSDRPMFRVCDRRLALRPR